jgi:Mrp family chromosome partitioning ATPase
VKVLAEIPSDGGPPPPAGTLRRRDLDAYDALLERLAGSRSVLVLGDAARRRAVAIGLATAAAAAGTRTALLECDLAEPALAEALGVAAAPGLHEYLRGEVEAERILEPLVLAGPGSEAAREPLVCVVAGRPAADDRELLLSERFRHAMAKLGSAYELLVLAGPAAGAAAAVTALAARVDATLACVGRGEAATDLPLSEVVTGKVVV